MGLALGRDLVAALGPRAPLRSTVGLPIRLSGANRSPARQPSCEINKEIR
jgi:hypothetical protein